MYFAAFTANDVKCTMWPYEDGEAWEKDVPVFVVMHERAEMVDMPVLEKLVKVWKETFHPSELPITPKAYGDATDAFARWLEAQPYGYFVPRTENNLITLP